MKTELKNKIDNFDLDDLINQFTEEINWKELYIDKLNEIEENGNTYCILYDAELV